MISEKCNDVKLNWPKAATCSPHCWCRSVIGKIFLAHEAERKQKSLVPLRVKIRHLRGKHWGVAVTRNIWTCCLAIKSRKFQNKTGTHDWVLCFPAVLTFFKFWMSVSLGLSWNETPDNTANMCKLSNLKTINSLLLFFSSKANILNSRRYVSVGTWCGSNNTVGAVQRGWRGVVRHTVGDWL